MKKHDSHLGGTLDTVTVLRGSVVETTIDIQFRLDQKGCKWEQKT
jgi:hypothetical protein